MVRLIPHCNADLRVTRHCGENSFIQLWQTVADGGVSGKAVAFYWQAEPIFGEFFIAVFIMIERYGVAAGYGDRHADGYFAFLRGNADAAKAFAFFEKIFIPITVKHKGDVSLSAFYPAYMYL